MNRFCCPASFRGKLLALILALSVTPALAGDTLTMNGKTASTEVLSLNGSAYVKLSDVAKALGMILVKRPGGYEITKPGGANQVQAVTEGKIGDVLFDGQWRFQVLSVETPAIYTAKFLEDANALHFDRSSHVVSALPRSKMVVVHCRMTNGQKSVQTFWIGHLDVKNALTDTAGESYPPDCYDLDGSTSQSKPLLPGAKTDFAILFSVPEATQLNDLIFMLRDNDFSTNGKSSDVRVSLTPSKSN